MAFLNESGLERLWSHIITKISTKVDKENGKGLSTNDYTNEEKEKLINTSDSVNTLNTLVGDTSVSEQINLAIESATADDFGIYVQANEPTDAVAGDIWIDTANDPGYIAPTIPEITSADNGKVLMVVNGTLQLVSLNLSVDANGVVSM